MKINELKNITDAIWELLLDADPNRPLVAEYLMRGKVFGMVHEEQVLVTIVLLPTRPETLEIINIATHKDFRGQGIATQLLQFAIDFAKEKKYTDLEIGTGSIGFEQLYLYQKCGFRMTSIDRDFFTRHYPEPIIENNLVLKDMVRLSFALTEKET